MRRQLRRRARLTVVVGLALGTSLLGASVAARQVETTSPADLTQRLRTIEHRKQHVQHQLQAIKRKQRTVTRELTRIDSKLERAERSLAEVSRDISRTRSDLEDATSQANAAAARLADHKDSVAARLVAIYQRGEVKPVEVLLHATSFADLANRLYLLNRVIGQDARLLDDFEQARQEAEARRQEVARKERQLQDLQDRIATEKLRVASERAATEQQKRDLLRDRAEWERALAELEEDSREVTALLQRLQKTPAGQARLAMKWTGSMVRPVEGRISSGYGYRVHPIYRVRKMHTGVDIVAPSGTPIRAAGAGMVVHAARWGGYGNCIIIDHGGGIATLYGHCSEIAVQVGQDVRQGQVIGYVGSTGLATGPHLHFEVRRDGAPINPEPYL